MDKRTCKHYTGTYHNEKCAAGVCYRDVTPEPDRREGSMLRIPCHSSIGFQTPSPGQLAEFAKRGTCEKYEEPTDADIAKHKAKVKAAVERFGKTMPLIQKVKNQHAGESWQGVEPCPVCGGTLHLSHAAVNGHVWGKCETDNCLSWME